MNFNKILKIVSYDMNFYYKYFQNLKVLFNWQN